MTNRTVHKLIRAATLSLLVLTTTAGVAGLQVLAASPAIADQGDAKADQGDAKEARVAEEAPAPAPAENPVTKLVGGLLGGLL